MNISKKLSLLKTVSIIIITFYSNTVFTQNIKDYSESDKMPAFYLGAGSGLNNNCGLIGVKVGLRLNERFLLDIGAGSGSWGNKIGLGLILNAVNKTAWCPAISFSRATGLSSAPLNLDVNNNFGFLEKEKLVNVQLQPTNLFNLSIQRQWIRPLTKNRIVLEFGYSIFLSGGEYGLLDLPGYELTSLSKAVLNTLRPGGLMIGFSYNWAL